MTSRVQIAGAGPAGLCAALLLSRAGASVSVCERRPRVGARFSGAVHGIENWSSPEPFTERLAAWGLSASDLGGVLGPCNELLMCDERAATRVRSPLPLFYLVRRGPEPDCLEGRLLQLARDAGADVRLGESSTPGSVDIDATGPERGRRVCVEAGIHFHTRSPDLAAALVSREATPAGYAYLLVHAGFGSLSAVRFDGRPVSQEQLGRCEQLLRRHVDIEVAERRPGAGFGSFSLLGSLAREGRWAIGESAGLQDMLWGFGIRRALESARLAARCWLDGNEYPTFAARALGIPDRAALVNRYIWDATAARGYRAYVGLLSRHPDVRAALGRATRERWLHRALYPLLSRHACRRFPHLGESRVPTGEAMPGHSVPGDAVPGLAMPATETEP